MRVKIDKLLNSRFQMIILAQCILYFYVSKEVKIYLIGLCNRWLSHKNYFKVQYDIFYITVIGSRFP
jgi:hypothetical protein